MGKSDIQDNISESKEGSPSEKTVCYPARQAKHNRDGGKHQSEVAEKKRGPSAGKLGPHNILEASLSYPEVAPSTPAKTGSPAEAGGPLYEAAHAYATRGIPVFPLHNLDAEGSCSCKEPRCGSPGKHPRTRRGFKDASTDGGKVASWWEKWPDANIGTPTGRQSNIFVLDVDKGHGDKPDGFLALAELEEEHGELPRTTANRTGNGGVHYVFSCPAEEVRSSAGVVGAGLDIRGDGGYVVMPPSRTIGAYEVLDAEPLAQPPKWLVEAARGASRGVSGPSERRDAIPIQEVALDNDAEPLPEGQRNSGLARIAGSLRARGCDRAAIEDALIRINEARCLPPLGAEEVRGVAASISRYPAGKAPPKVGPRVHEILDAIEVHVDARVYKGQGGFSDRDVYIKLVNLARVYGQKLPKGDVAVSVSMRQIAELAAVGVATASRSVKRLEEAGDVRRSKKGKRKKGDSGTIVLTARKVEHSDQQGGIEERGLGRSTVRSTVRSGSPRPRLRWSAPIRQRVGDTWDTVVIRRLGKVCGAIIDHLDAAGGELALTELFQALQKPKARARDMLRESPTTVGPIMRLINAGVVECFGDVARRTDVVRLADGWLEALEAERMVSGEVDAERRQRVRHRRDREAFARRHEEKPVAAPTLTQMAAHRRDYPRRRREAIAGAIAALFEARPEYRGRRVGQVTCALHDFLPEDYPRRIEDGYPNDAEVEDILDGVLGGPPGPQDGSDADDVEGDVA